MPNRSDAPRRLWLGLRNELVRGGLCTLVLFGLLASDTPVWLVLALPAAAYVGLWLLTGQTAEAEVPRPTPSPSSREIREAYAASLRSHQEINAFGGDVADPQLAAIVGRVTSGIDRILDVISEDEKYQASLTLLELMTPTRNLLSRYSKLVRRGLDGAEVRERVRENLETLDNAYLDFWARLNDDALPDLDELGETINRTLDQMTVPRRAPSLPPELPAETTQSVPAEIQKLISALTPRQLEVLRKLTTGATNQELADMLYIGIRTVEKHLDEIYSKINVRNRAEAVAFAVRWGLVV